MTNFEKSETNTRLNKESVRMKSDLNEWTNRQEELIAQGARIIAFRGAGTVNGIEPNAAHEAVGMLRDYIVSITDDGTTVALMYDGDADNRDKPDIGSIFGELIDSLSGNAKVIPIAAQTEGWYSPDVPNGSIENTNGVQYETYVFPDNVPGAHAALTQSERLVEYEGYEQVFVGPAGPIAFNQLQDLSQKAGRIGKTGQVPVTVIATRNNSALTQELNEKLSAESNEQDKAKIQAKIDQRSNQPYGALLSSDGEFIVNVKDFPHIRFNVRSIID